MRTLTDNELCALIAINTVVLIWNLVHLMK